MNRILLVKTSSLGDVVHMCPAVSDAARARPGLEIHWVVEEAFAGVPRLHRDVSRVIPLALRRWRKSLWRPAMWRELASLRRLLAQEHYDAIIDAQGLVKSAIVAAMARGPRHGFNAASAREPLAARGYGTVHAVPRALHAVERNRLLVSRALGYTVDEPLDYGMRLQKSSQEPVAVLLSVASRPKKLWPEENWISLGRALVDRGLRVVLPWGTSDEQARAGRIARAIGPAADVPQRIPLEALAEVFASARVVAGGDTGLTHLALAAGAPTAGIYCATDPALTGLWGGRRMRNLGGPGIVPSTADAIEACEGLLG